MNPGVNSTLCPVCGFDLGFEPWHDDSASHEICPSCGIEFGYDDVPEASGNQGSRQEIYQYWRRRWIQDGMSWWSTSRKPPIDWNPQQQLGRLLKKTSDP